MYEQIDGSFGNKGGTRHQIENLVHLLRSLDEALNYCLVDLIERFTRLVDVIETSDMCTYRCRRVNASPQERIGLR